MKKAALLLLATTVLGCSDDPTEPAPSGTITISSTAIANQQGKYFVVFATAGGQGQAIGRACLQITSNSFAVPAMAMADNVAGSDPCATTGAAKSFTGGSYTLTASIYVGGSQTPLKMTSRTVEVSGNVTASFDGTALGG